MERDFKGVWIPKTVWLDDRLNALDKIILVEVDSLDQGERGCYASNEHLAAFCQCSKTKVSTAISKLVEYGYLYVQKYDGRSRELKSRLSNFERQAFNFCKADSQILKESNTDRNTVTNTTKERGNASRSNAPTKHKYGEYKNVLLSDSELQKLKEEIPNYQSYIENLSGYIASTGKKYKSHYATIRQWFSRDKKSGEVKQSKYVTKQAATSKEKSYDDRFMELVTQGKTLAEVDEIMQREGY